MMLGRIIRQFFLKPFELPKARKIDVSKMKTIGIILGPYRNLTTLTTGILSLHPNCQVLNHAGIRLLPWKNLNIFNNLSAKNLKQFKQYAVYMSGGGKRGDWGGSITYSHAFTHKTMSDLYKNRYSDKLIKTEINSLVWKESLRIANYIKIKKIDVKELLKGTPGLRFILPVRNPLDCAASNLKTGKTKLFDELDDSASLKQTISAILKEFRWFLDLRSGNSENFFYFFQHNFNEKMLTELNDFLKLKRDSRWIEASLDVFKMKSTYKFKPEIIEHFKKEVKKLFSNEKGFMENLLKFVEA